MEGEEEVNVFVIAGVDIGEYHRVGSQKQGCGSNGSSSGDDGAVCFNICTGWNHAHCMDIGVTVSAISPLSVVVVENLRCRVSPPSN
jgi:hypothetical protein